MLKHLRARTEDQNLLQKGFTLVELLVVIVILGILAAVVVFAVGGTEGKARANSCKSEQATIEAAYETYKADHEGTPPGSYQDLKNDGLIKRDPAYLTKFDWEKGVGTC